MATPDGFSSRAAVSASGAIIYIQGGGALPRNLLMVSRSGQVSAIPGTARPFVNPRVSPDGKRLAVDITDPATSDKDRARVVDGLRSLAVATPESVSPMHFRFGRMSLRDWHHWAYKHVDHHLRQFGV